MTIGLIFFITAILLGIVFYWRESKDNKLYRFVNRVFNSEELQMKKTNKKGFVYQQSFLLRLVYISVLFLLTFIIFQFIVPIQITTVSIFASMVTGTLLGTYIASLIFKSSEILEEQTNQIEGFVQDTIDKGKDLINDIKEDEVKEVKVEEENKVVEEKLSARERLKNKGYL